MLYLSENFRNRWYSDARIGNIVWIEWFQSKRRIQIGPRITRFSRIFDISTDSLRIEWNAEAVIAHTSSCEDECEIEQMSNAFSQDVRIDFPFIHAVHAEEEAQRFLLEHFFLLCRFTNKDSALFS